MQKVSVLMPVYNTEESFLREAIESILNQTFKDFEFLIINDGSTNNAEEIILSYNDERIKYIKNECNIGLIKTLNKGLELAQGEYIARMDSDDISLSERFEKQVKFLDENPEIGVLGTWFNCFPKNRIVETAIDSENIKEKMLVSSNEIGHPTVMIRNSALKNFNVKYDENELYVEDYALWLSLIDKVKFANIPEVLLNYRMHKNSICQTNTIAQSLNCAKIMVKAQGEHFKINSTDVLNLVDKLQHNQKIKSSELLIINEFVQQIKTKMQEENFSYEYEINRDFYKIAIKMCEKDLLFYKFLWSKNINEFIKPRFGFRILNSLNFLSKTKIKEISAESPKISAIMALYNTPNKFLEKTLKSILNQTYSNFELIIIDDASTIEYKDFFKKFGDKRIKYFKLEKNAGPGHARNVGIEKALGEYVAIVDSDDIYYPKRFEKQLNFLETNTDISLLSCAFKFSNKHKISEVLEKDEDIKLALLFNSAISNPAVMFRKKDFMKNNLLYAEDINFAEDYALWVDAMFCGLKMANLKDVLMTYTRRRNQLSKAKVNSQSIVLKQLYKKVFDKLGIDTNSEEIEIHFSINNEIFKTIEVEKIISWFNKIIDANKNKKIFEEQKLIDLKIATVEKINKIKNIMFKIKIGNYNLCFNKNFQITIKERN